MAPETQATEPKYIVTETREADTGLKLYSTYDPETGITISIPQTPRLDLPTFLAATGARFSRFAGTVAELYKDIYTRKITPGEFMQRILSYGHASVAEMAEIRLDFQGITHLMATKIFNVLRLGAGQEKSTRYVPWEEQIPLPLRRLLTLVPEEEFSNIEQKYLALFGRSRVLYEKWQSLINPRIKNHIEEHREYVPEGTTEGQIRSSILARTLDIARRWILMGNRSSMMYQANIRVWGDLITYFRASPDITFQALANQIEYTLQIKRAKPKFRGDYAALMKYKETDGRIFQNIQALQQYLVQIDEFNNLDRDQFNILEEQTVEKLDLTPGETVFFEYIKAFQPDINNIQLINFIRNLDDGIKKQISTIIFKGHHKHNKMREVGDTRGILIEFFGAIADLRDFNRQRAAGIMFGLWHTQDIDAVIKAGFDRSIQLFESGYLQDLQDEWQADATIFYGELNEFVDLVRPYLNDQNRYLIYHLLPFGHRVRQYYSSSAAQLAYFLNLRGVEAHEYEKGKSLGGDASYVRLAEHAYDLIVGDPYFAGLLGGSSDERERFDPNNVAHLLGRS